MLSGKHLDLFSLSLPNQDATIFSLSAWYLHTAYATAVVAAVVVADAAVVVDAAVACCQLKAHVA